MKTSGSPSVAEVLLTEKLGPATSLSLIVPTPWASVIVAPPVAPDRLTLSVSVLSTVVSLIVGTVTGFVVSVAANVSVPDVAV